jgi:predicted nucleotidyltransferase
VDLGSPLASLIGPIDAAVLGVLSRTSAPLAGRQVHRLAGVGSPAGVNSSLARLGATGLVLGSVRSYATLYRLNRDHLLWPAVESGLNAMMRFRSQIRSFADGGPAGISIVLYGSVERGDASADSDVDILVVFPDAVSSQQAEDFAFELGERIRLWTGNAAQVIRITESELSESANHDDPLVSTWLNHSEVLVGDLHHMTGMS